VLRRVREVSLQAQEHLELPFERLVERLAPGGAAGQTPLFQTMFNMLNVPGDEVQLSDLTVEAFPSSDLQSIVDLTLYAEDAGEEIRLGIVYDSGLFDDSFIDGMFRNYETLLERATTDLAQPISSVCLVTRADRARLAARADRVRPACPFVEFPTQDIEQSIADRFACQVTRHGAMARKRRWRRAGTSGRSRRSTGK
jgi:non-ribosomal peptide synthetase component F